jgi:hypothetical protein
MIERLLQSWLFVTHMDMDYEAKTVVYVCKTILIVRDTFRTAKSLLETRPVCRNCDERIRFHGFCSSLVLWLKR